MKIDYISDLHVDFWLDLDIDEKKLSDSYILNKMFSNASGEILLIAGDIGHYNEQNVEYLKLILKVCGYKHIFFVLGNHDYYIIRKQWEIYNGNSFNRIEALKSLVEPLENITLLDGDIYNYKGINIGGCSMWYDGEYTKLLNPRLSDEGLKELWKDSMMDAIHIGGISNFKELFDIEITKLQNIYKKSDIILTHINPLISATYQLSKYALNTLNGFYCFDGEYFIENTSTKHWLFGHTHQPIEYKVHDINVHCNPLGYPHESSIEPKIKSFEFDR